MTVTVLRKNLLYMAILTSADGCPREEVPIIPGCSALVYNWTESDIGDTVTYPCPCQDLLDASSDPVSIVRHCEGTYTFGAEWEEVDSSQCGLSMVALQLCAASLVCGFFSHLYSAT